MTETRITTNGFSTSQKDRQILFATTRRQDLLALSPRAGFEEDVYQSPSLMRYSTASLSQST